MPEVSVDPYSLTTVRLTMLRDDLELAVGSGMLWRHGTTLAIVTAWHNVTGAHYETRQPLSKSTGARPNRVRAAFLDAKADTVHNLTIDLRTIDDQPGWVVHPRGSAAVDLAAVPIPLEIPQTVINQPVNGLPNDSIAVNVGSELFVVGYPLGISRLGLPIWKRASLAVEPQSVFDADGHRYAIVDSATREGLSGAPVFARREGMALSADGKLTYATKAATSFFGIYTGRLSTADPLGAQLGIVWPSNLVNDLFTVGITEDFF
jgi:trypsin-like peptidase